MGTPTRPSFPPFDKLRAGRAMPERESSVVILPAWMGEECVLYPTQGARTVSSTDAGRTVRDPKRAPDP